MPSCGMGIYELEDLGTASEPSYETVREKIAELAKAGRVQAGGRRPQYNAPEFVLSFFLPKKVLNP